MLLSLLIPLGLLALPAPAAHIPEIPAPQVVNQAADKTQETTNKPKEKFDLGKAGEWKSLFDGKSLVNWKQTNFSGGGEVRVEAKFRDEKSAIVLNNGLALSGFNWVGKELPKTNYEVSLEVLKIDGNDFLCGLTFPVEDAYASLILGGWGGGVVGVSSVDGNDASENETTKYMGFMKDRWYKVRLKVTPAKIEAWVDEKQMVDLELKGKKISLRRGEIDRSIPLGISTYQTSAAYRALRMRKIEAK